MLFLNVQDKFHVLWNAVWLGENKQGMVATLLHTFGILSLRGSKTKPNNHVT